MWKYKDTLLSPQEVISLINGLLSGVVILDGIKKKKKTTIIKAIEGRSKKIFTAEFFGLLLSEIDKKIGIFDPDTWDPDVWTASYLDTLVEWIDGYNIICFEDIDMMLNGKEATTEEILNLVANLAEESLVIITGIHIRSRVPNFVENLDAKEFYYQFTG